MDATLVAQTFRTSLGWVAMLGRGPRLVQVAFGADSAPRALTKLDARRLTAARIGRWNTSLQVRLRRYAAGAVDDFRDVEVDLDQFTAFQRRVLAICREIPFGQTISYAQLAARAGSPAAARAVGQVMRRNPVPLIIPCHRVTGSAGLGGYSGAAGLETKQRLLALETGALAKRRLRRDQRTANVAK